MVPGIFLKIVVKADHKISFILCRSMVVSEEASVLTDLLVRITWKSMDQADLVNIIREAG